MQILPGVALGEAPGMLEYGDDADDLVGIGGIWAICKAV